MASPFSVFRRNQKIILAVVGVAAMIAFVFLDPLMRYVGANRKAQNPTVVTTKFGDLTQADMYRLRQSRELVDGFLQSAASEMMFTLSKAGMIDSRMAGMQAQQMYMGMRQQLTDRSTLNPEEAAVETFILAKTAEKNGMVVSDATINELIRELTADALPKETIMAIVSQVQGGGTANLPRLFDALRMELLATRFTQSFVQSIRDVTPAQRFEYYERLNRRAKAEVVALAVADFAPQVPDPTPAELEKFFDQYKDRFADPNSPEPGFKQPVRASFQYFTANFEQFKEEAKAQITDQEMLDYYIKNKEMYREVPKSEEEKTETSSETPPADAEAKPNDEPTEKPAEDKPPATEAVNPPPTEQPAENATENQPDNSNRAPRRNGLGSRSTAPVVLASARLEQDPADEQNAAPAAQQATSETAQPPVETPPATETGAAQVNVDDKPADDKPADPPADEPPAEAPVDVPRYQPLAAVADKVRDSLASQKASDRIGLIIDQLKTDMKTYADEREDYEAEKANNPNAQPPKPFPFVELAKAKNVAASELPLITAAEAANEAIGKTSRIVRGNQGFRSETFPEFAFAPSFRKFLPTDVFDGEGNTFLFWKTDEAAAYVPKLEDVRDTVVAAWKMIKARDLARKRADEYAQQARAAVKPLAEVFAGQENLKVIDTGTFSWLTQGNVPLDSLSSQPRLSTVEGVQRIGNEFMESVFKLPAGGVGVATNEPQDTMYVIRLTDYEKPMDDLLTAFSTEPPVYYLPVGITDQRKMYTTWLADVNKSANVHWDRPPETARNAGPATPQGSDFDFQ